MGVYSSLIHIIEYHGLGARGFRRNGTEFKIPYSIGKTKRKVHVSLYDTSSQAVMIQSCIVDSLAIAPGPELDILKYFPYDMAAVCAPHFVSLINAIPSSTTEWLILPKPHSIGQGARERRRRQLQSCPARLPLLRPCQRARISSQAQSSTSRHQARQPCLRQGSSFQVPACVIDAAPLTSLHLALGQV